MQSKRKPVETIPVDDLNGDFSSESIKTSVVGYEEKPKREPGKKYTGEPEEIAKEVAQLLDTAENVI
jgi:electron transfer flavoprotein beta subunit